MVDIQHLVIDYWRRIGEMKRAPWFPVRQSGVWSSRPDGVRSENQEEDGGLTEEHSVGVSGGHGAHGPAVAGFPGDQFVGEADGDAVLSARGQVLQGDSTQQLGVLKEKAERL